MANHVDGYLNIQTNEAGQKVWQKYTDKLDAVQYGEPHLAELFFEDMDDPKLDREWMCDNIGAKWAYARDWDEDGVSMYSAWGPCFELAERIIKEIGQVDPDVFGRLTFEDEMPNFVGVNSYNKDGVDEEFELDWDEVAELCRADNEDLLKLWDAEDCEWTDEEAASDIIQEIQWDIINEWQSKQC